MVRCKIKMEDNVCVLYTESRIKIYEKLRSTSICMNVFQATLCTSTTKKKANKYRFRFVSICNHFSAQQQPESNFLRQNNENLKRNPQQLYICFRLA